MRLAIGVAALAAAGALAMGGCTKDGDTFIQNVIAASLPGNFPGAPTTANDVASDGQAFSEPGTVGFGTAVPRYFGSGVGNRGITLYINAGAGGWVLYAHYYDGTNFSPPVALLGGNQDPSAVPSIADAAVLFINDASSFRNGDALIFWRRDDLDDYNAGTQAGVNTRLFYTYFDRSLAGTPASGTNGVIQYGFNSVATAIDQDDDAGVDVDCFALYSDGLHGMASFATGSNQYGQGDPTTYAGVVFTQGTFSAPAVRDSYFCSFDLSSSNTTNSMNTAAPFGQDSGFTSGTDDVLPIISTYNGSVFCIYNDVTPTYQYLTWNVWGSQAAPSGFISSGHKLTPGTGTLSGLLTNIGSGWGGVIGPDEGNVTLIGGFQVVNQSYAGNVDMYVFQLDPSTGTAPGGNDMVEIDADTTNSGANPQPTIIQTQSGAVCRTGEYAIVIWKQTRGNSAANNGVALWCQAIQLTRSGTAPALNTRIASGGAQQIDAVTTGNNSTGNQVQEVKFQQDVAPGCSGVQSNRYVMHVIWHQDDDPDTLDRVRTRRITFTPTTGAGQPSAPSLGTERMLPDFNAGELANTGGSGSPGGWNSVIGVDAGGQGGNPGDLAMYYIRDINSSAPSSFRAFQKIEGSTEIQIGSLVGVSGSAKECVQLSVAQLPKNNDLTNNPNWTGQLHQVFFSEARYDNPSSGGGGPDIALRARYYDKNDTTVGFGNRFTPVVGSSSPPMDLDIPTLGPASNPGQPLTSGNLAGSFWYQGGHLWYQEFNVSTRKWWTSSGVSAPELIDHEGNATISGGPGAGINTTVADPCDNLHRFILFWLKPDDNGNDRWRCRVRN